MTLSVSALGEETQEPETNYDDQIMTTAATTSTVNIAFTPTSANASVTPVDSNGAKAKVDVQATVRVQKSGGYNVYIGSNSSQLKNGSNVIDSVTSAKTYAQLPVNSWGYSFRKASSATDKTVADSYVAMPATLRSTASDSNTSTNISDETRYYMLSFAANVGSDKPAGTYTNQVTMSVVSSPLEISDLTGIANMQEMTSEICASSAEGATKQLKDTRDNKYYWVTKLADGKCWMTQNLDLDLSTGTALSNTTTDLNSKSSWTPSYSTATIASTSTILENNTGQRSWSLGNYRITNPAGTASSVSGKSSAADYPNQFTSYITPTTANGDENAHYILGNHYQWNAATAGTGGTIISGQATSSICPKGWRLPTSGKSADGNSDIGEFQELVAATNIASGSDIPQFVSAPYYFVRGGYVDQGDNGVWSGNDSSPDGYTLFANAGLVGNYWSSTPNSNGTSAYNLFFRIHAYASSSYIRPFNTNIRQLGYSVRCVAR